MDVCQLRRKLNKTRDALVRKKLLLEAESIYLSDSNCFMDGLGMHALGRWNFVNKL